MERIDLERHEESIFPARILLATDGTEEGNVTVRTAVDLARKTGTELHLVYVGKVYRPPYYERPRGYETEEAVETAERAVLDKQVMRVESAGGVVAGAHLEHRWPDQDPAERIVALAEEIEDRPHEEVAEARPTRPQREDGARTPEPTGTRERT